MHEPEGTPAFDRVYHLIRAGEYTPTRQLKAGSFAKLVALFQASPQWRQSAENTQKQRRSMYGQILRQAPDAPADSLTPDDVRRMVHNRADTPGAANNFLKALKALYKWGIIAGHVSRNPAEGVAKLPVRTSGFTPWTLDDVRTFTDRFPSGTRQHRVLMLLLFTAARKSDIVHLGRQNVRGGWISWEQAKTGQRVSVPILPPLQAAIDACPDMMFALTEHGKPFSVAGFGNWWSEQVRSAGLKNPAPAHGLRKAAGALLAECGCSEHEIMAVLGHSTSKEAAVYTATARRRALAESAMEKLGKVEW